MGLIRFGDGAKSCSLENKAARAGVLFMPLLLNGTLYLLRHCQTRQRSMVVRNPLMRTNGNRTADVA